MDQSLFSAPHNLSQSITSFIASYCQGIHQTPFSRLIWSRRRQAFCMSCQHHPKMTKFWTKSHTKLFPWAPAGSKRGQHSCRHCPDRAATMSKTLRICSGIIVLNLEQNYFVNCCHKRHHIKQIWSLIPISRDAKQHHRYTLLGASVILMFVSLFTMSSQSEDWTKSKLDSKTTKVA